MLFPIVALTAVFAIATGTAIEPIKQVEEDSGVATEKAAALPPPATTDGGHEEEVRRMLKRTAAEKAAAKAAKAAAKAAKAEAEKAEAALIASGGSGSATSLSSNIFEKLGFCNTKTLRGRYTFFSLGNGNLSPEFARDPDAVVDPAGPVGPIAISGFTYFDGKGNAFSEISSRPDSGGGALGPLVIFDLWSKYDVLKNCSNLLKGEVLRFRATSVAPALIIPATTLFFEGNVAPDGRDNVFTIFDTERVVAFSGDQKQVAKFAIPPENFENPPRLPTCFASQSCSSQYEGEPCQQNKDCRIACFPECGMTCTRTSPLGGKACERSF